ncbi:aldehyde dehydrogenase family protein [Marivibrio halodurans]|uniref:Aldehyde dehydrogenase family protein n=1 Tax=Marivibrio halodurans TaxID=2039722 RepID=A0A8J7V3P3_9PROT|nr:aldehyde dehydrogenase family protein [Marivibrio halodurans]MBP5858600.1 aldehyde dehydrogenase family protein [Marivibrio halodurans]
MSSKPSPTSPQASPQTLPHYIGGEAVAGTDLFECMDPYRNEPVCRAPTGGAADVAAAVAAAREAAPAVAAMPAYERAAILRRVADLVVERADEIGAIMARETGKALGDARGEVKRSMDTLSLSAEEAIRIEGTHVPLDGSAMGHGKMAFLMRFPVGVVGAITPFNAPFNLACHKLAPAFAAGNASIIKPPQQCPMVVHRLVELFYEAGMPRAFIQVVHGGPETGRALVENPGVDLITFTGSSRVGAMIRAASGLRPVALELGGTGPTIVCDDADLDAIAPLLARNAVRLAGQSCISVQNIHVPRALADTLGKKIAAEMEKLVLGDPLADGVDVGTLIDEAAARRVEGWVDEARQGGARVLTGGARDGAAYQPTLLTDVTSDMKVVCDEVFGPVASIVAYDDLDRVATEISESRYGLQCGVFTDSTKRALSLARRLRTGGVIINGSSTWRTDQLAYGGVKDSGIGREGPRYAMRDMTEERLILFNY